MRNLILIIAILGLSLNSKAQSKKLKERTTAKAEYVAKAMKLNEENKTFLYETLLNNTFEANKKKKGLTKEEKKVINKDSRKELKTKLSEKFSKEEVKQIFALLKEKRNLNKNNRESKK